MRFQRLLGLSLGLSACSGGSSSGPEAGGGADAGTVDGGAPDAGHDAGLDAGQDSGADAGTDVDAGPCADTGQLFCGGTCVDPQTNAMHCNGCDSPCDTNETCAGGACSCPAAFSVCGEACVDTMTDDAHCGGCNAPCASYQTCSAGECVHNECAAEESASPPTHACLETRVRDGFRSDTSPLCLQTNTATDQTCHLPASVCTSGSNGCDVDARVVSVTASGPMTGTGGNQVVVLTVDVAVDADLTYAGAHGIAIPFFGDLCTLTVRSDEEAGEVFRADVVLNGRIDETSGEFVAGCAGDSTGGLQNIQPNYVLSLSGDFGQGCNLAGAIITSVQAIINALITDQVLGEVCNEGMERRCLPCDDSCATDSGLTCSLTAP